MTIVGIIYQYFTVTNTVLSVCLAAVLTYRLIQWRYDVKVRSLGGYGARIPTWAPFGLDYLVQVFQHTNSNRFIGSFEKDFAKYGHAAAPHTVDVQFAGARVILTADSENIKAILSTQFDDYGKGEDFRNVWGAFLGNSIFVTDGAIWKHNRAMLRPQFVRERVADLEIVDRHAMELVSMLGNGGQTVEMLDYFFRFTLDTAIDFLLGMQMDNLKHGKTQFGTAFSEVQRLNTSIYKMGKWHTLFPRADFNRHLRTVDSLVNHYVQAALTIPATELDKTTSDTRYTLLHGLVESSRDPEVLRGTIMSVLLAGRDSTACTLAWMFLELAQNQSIVDKLRHEVLSTIGDTAAPSYEQLKSMKYLQNTISETLRLYPLLAVNGRMTLRDTTLPRGGGENGLGPIGMPAGTMIWYTAYSLQMQAEAYPAPGEVNFIDPLKFEPDRWKTWTPKPWTYIPFNAGPRLCVGQQFALMEMSCVVVRILQRFSTLSLSPRTQAVMLAKDIKEANEEKLFFKNGTESYAWRLAKRRERTIRMKADPLTAPAEGIEIVFG